MQATMKLRILKGMKEVFKPNGYGRLDGPYYEPTEKLQQWFDNHQGSGEWRDVPVEYSK